MLSFTFLGQTVLFKNGAPLSNFRSQKEASLLIYLAHTGQTQQREFLAELLWDSSSTKQALSNLRTVLTRLRKQINADLIITRKTLSLSPESLQQIDSAILLQTLASTGQIDSDAKAEPLLIALESYQGAFLADFHMSDAPRFEAWVITTREHIHRQVMAAFNKLAQYAQTRGNSEQGIAIAQRWLQADALNEAAHTLLIRLKIQQGNVREAIEHYTHAANLLKTELDIEPPAEMQALIEAVRPKPVSLPRPANVTRHNLPAAHDQFFGRKNAQQEIHTRLDQPWCRLVTIFGQGGVGKTRLAATIAHSRLSQYPDGVWLVELENIDEDDEDLAEAIAVEIATILDMRLSGSVKPVDQLLDHLQHKQMMLVLDNFEHLLEGVALVMDIVQRCDKVQLLITSREALRIRAEWAIALTGLGYPSSYEDAVQSEAVELFVARQAQQRRGELTEEEVTAVYQICRLVEGLPLAIELAAALTRHATCAEVANQLHEGFDLLATSLRDMPQRHRSLQVVFEMSWQTLAPELQGQLAQISIFRSGFDETAVSHITEATNHHLAELIDKSLLTYHPETARYTLHPVIRSYAAGKRPSDDPTPQKHAHYFLNLLAQHTEPLQKEAPQKSMYMLEPDIENIRRAWQTGLSERQTDFLFDALTSLSIYYQLRGLAREGEAVMHTTLRLAMAWGDKGIQLAARAGLEQARFLNRLGHYRPAIRIIKTMLKLAKDGNDHWAEGMGYVWWGESLWRLGKYATAKEKLAHALNIGNKLDITEINGWAHHQLGIIHDIQGSYDAAHNNLEKACASWQVLNHARILSVSLNSIGLVYRNQGDLSSAKRAMEKALAICVQQENRYLEAMLLNNLSSLLIFQGDYFGAQYYLQLGLELAKINGSLASQSDIYINMGENYRLQEAHELAIQHFEKGLKIAESIGNLPSIAEALCKLADLKRIQNNLIGAETTYNQALAIARNNNLKPLEFEVLIGLIRLFHVLDTLKAQEYGQEVENLAKQIGHPNLLKRVEEISRDLL
ncbi:MAG: transcriptional activator [Ardenticatenaceae bacterium]|nr:MAG: transcriptional activator [Ardenticatenaceae bacterium]